MSLLERNTTRREQIEKITEDQLEFEDEGEKESEVKAIVNIAIYTKKSEIGLPPSLY